MRCPSGSAFFLILEFSKTEICMKTLVKLLIVFSLSSTMQAAYADYEMLQKNNCFACHYIDKRKYGPKFNEVAEKYAGEANAVEKIAKKIKSGGSGVWGEDMMPPQAQVSDADALALAKYILSLK